MRAPMKVDRRSFLQRAGVLLSALGVGGAIHAGLLDDLRRKGRLRWGRDAFAGTQAPGVKFVIEIPIRAGYPITSLFPTYGHKYDVRTVCLNQFSSAANIDPFVPAVGRELYFARFNAGLGADALRTRLQSLQARMGLATSVGIINTTAHTTNFPVRAPNVGVPCPAVLHASVARRRPVQAFSWGTASVTNQTAGLAPPVSVTNRAGFLAAAVDVPTYFTNAELKLVIDQITGGTVVSVGGTGSLDDVFSVRNVRGTPELKAISIVGRGRAQTPMATAMNAVYAQYTPSMTNLTENRGGILFADALLSALSAFAAGQSSTFTVTVDSSDWTADIYALDDTTSKQAVFNRYIGTALADFLGVAAICPDPEEPGKTILDSLLISITSEFARFPILQGSCFDNGDGGSTFLCYLGSPVKTGSFGNITGAGLLEGFDPVTGVTTTGVVPSATETMAWRTTGKLMGVSSTLLDQYAPGIASIDAVIR